MLQGRMFYRPGPGDGIKDREERRGKEGERGKGRRRLREGRSKNGR